LVSASTESSELEPSFSESTPSKLYSEAIAVESELRSVPMPVSAVSCASSAVSWFFQGVSTACRFPTIALTVVDTSKP
jgi:hypothetical protein